MVINNAINRDNGKKQFLILEQLSILQSAFDDLIKNDLISPQIARTKPKIKAVCTPTVNDVLTKKRLA